MKVNGHNGIAAVCRVVLIARGLDAAQYDAVIYGFANDYGDVMDAEIIAANFAYFLGRADTEHAEQQPVPVVETRENPFITLEALSEHVGSLWYALSQAGYEVGVAGERPRFAAGTPGYHLNAVEDAANRLFQKLATMLPDNYQWGG